MTVRRKKIAYIWMIHGPTDWSVRCTVWIDITHNLASIHIPTHYMEYIHIFFTLYKFDGFSSFVVPFPIICFRLYLVRFGIQWLGCGAFCRHQRNRCRRSRSSSSSSSSLLFLLFFLCYFFWMFCMLFGGVFTHICSCCLWLLLLLLCHMRQKEIGDRYFFPC